MRNRAIVYDCLQWWGTLAFVSVVANTMKQIGIKELLEYYPDTFAILVAYNVMVLALCAPVIALLMYRRALSYSLWTCGRTAALALAGWLVTDVAGTFAFTEALRIGELSIVGPLRHTGTVFSFFLGYVLFKQRISAYRKLAGAAVVMLGAFLLQGFDYSRTEIFASLLAIGSAMLFAVTGAFERWAVDRELKANMSPFAFGFIGAAISIPAYGSFYLADGGSPKLVLLIIEHTMFSAYLFGLVVVGGTISMWLGVKALVTGELAQVSAVRRLGILAAIGAGAIYFDESWNDKLLGGVVLLVGVVLVALPSHRKKTNAPQ